MKLIAFSIGPLVLHWYGIILAFSILCGVLISVWQVRIFRECLNSLFEIVLLCIPLGLIAARFYYVASHMEEYHSTAIEWITFWHGGLAIHGALIGITAGLCFYTFKKKISFWRWADILSPGLAMAQAIGQWGNFINQEAFGYPTEASWGIYIDFAFRPLGYECYDYFHPTALYESGLAFAIFIFLALCNRIKGKIKLKEGSIFLVYILLYSLVRFFIEGLRLDSEFLWGFRLAQVVSAICIITASLLLIYRNIGRSN